MWEEHFRNISASSEEQFPAMSCVKEQVQQLMAASLENEDTLLDVPFCSDEVESALKRLKCGKSPGHDLLQPEHLKYGGVLLQRWVQQICNAITDKEHVPDCLKIGIIIPVYKGVAKTPWTPTAIGGLPSHLYLPKCLNL